MTEQYAVYTNDRGYKYYAKRSGKHFRIEVFSPSTGKTFLFETRRYLKATQAQDALDQMADAKQWRFVRFQNVDDVKDLLKYGGGAK